MTGRFAKWFSICILTPRDHMFGADSTATDCDRYRRRTTSTGESTYLTPRFAVQNTSLSLRLLLRACSGTVGLWNWNSGRKFILLRVPLINRKKRAYMNC